MHACKVVQLIEATDSRGEGTADNPHRMVLQYWTFDGRLLFEVDQWVDTAAEWGSAQFGGEGAESGTATPKEKT